MFSIFLLVSVTATQQIISYYDDYGNVAGMLNVHVSIILFLNVASVLLSMNTSAVMHLSVCFKNVAGTVLYGIL